MWRLLSEELRANRTVLPTAWGFGIGIYALVLGLLWFLAGAKDRGELPGVAGQLPIALLVASLVACFIVSGTDRAEYRVRMLAMLPLPVRDVALARVLVPTAMIAAGALVSHAGLALAVALKGAPFRDMQHLRVEFVAAVLLAWALVVLAAREIIEYRKARGWRRSLLPKSAVVAAVVLLVALQIGQVGFLPLATAGAAAVDAALAAVVVGLFCRRADFTK